MKLINAGGIIGVFIGAQLSALVFAEHRQTALGLFLIEVIAIAFVMAVNALFWLAYCRKHGIR